MPRSMSSYNDIFLTAAQQFWMMQIIHYWLEEHGYLIFQARSNTSKKQQSSTKNLPMFFLNLFSNLPKKLGVYTPNQLAAAGFEYTGDGDTAICKDCKLEISNWTLEMKPFSVHVQQSPQCSYVKSMQPKPLTPIPTVVNHLTTSDSEIPSKQQKIEVNEEANGSSIWKEAEAVKEIRKRTFSRWPHRTSPWSAQMIEAGFFNCNVGDRVICLYCNLICQQWAPNVDNPWKTHQMLSPKCPYVIATLKEREKATIQIVNEQSTNTDLFRSNDIVYTAACHQNYTEISQRHASFETLPAKNAPPIDDFVRAGFFYTGTKAIVTCFYCNGSLQNWGASDNPMIEHARWFPHCAYAKQLYETELHRKVQESKRAQQGMFICYCVS